MAAGKKIAASAGRNLCFMAAILNFAIGGLLVVVSVAGYTLAELGHAVPIGVVGAAMIATAVVAAESLTKKPDQPKAP